jgi:peptidoglycan/xylan/chitin deacetylase (PgdA/CDA1 family)
VLKSLLRPYVRRQRRVWARKRAGKGLRGIILNYHRVASPAHDPWNLSVTPRHFAEQMAEIGRRGAARPLQGLISSGEPVEGLGVAVTFDDGYVDNLTSALPILEQFEIPATVFVVANTLDTGEPYWWDVLTHVLLDHGDLPPKLTLEAGGHSRSWRIPPPAPAGRKPWRADFQKPVTERQRLYLDLWSWIVTLGSRERQNVARRLCDWAGVSTQTCAKAQGRPMTRDELSRLATSPVIEIGGHSSNHSDLSALDRQQVCSEVKAGKDALGSFLRKPISAFAYPYGRHGSTAIEAVQDAGYACAVATHMDLVTVQTDRFILPRYPSEDIGGKRFARFLDDLLGKS